MIGKIDDGVQYNGDTDDYNFDFSNDLDDDIIHLTKRSYNQKLSKTQNFNYFVSYKAGSKYIKGQKDVFLRKLKTKQVDNVDYSTLIETGVKYLDDFIDLKTFDVIITPKSTSPLLKDMLNEIDKYISDDTIVIDSLFVKNSIENISNEIKKLKFKKPETEKSFGKQFSNSISTGEFKMKDIKFMPFRRLITNFLTISDEIEVELVKKISNSKVLIVDDIISTNTTMLEMNRLITELQPNEIFGFVLIG